MDYDFSNTDEQKHPDLESTLTTLRDNDGVVNSTVYYGLSGLEYADIDRLAPVWEHLTASYRRKVVRELLEASEANFELNYEVLGQFVLDDNDAGVREAAVELLWEDESLVLMNRLIQIALYDEAINVRAAAASALGRFILLGELGDLPEDEISKAQDTAISILDNLAEDLDVRRRALEAIANSSHDILDDAIREAYANEDQRMQISAVFAMGRSYDSRWNEFVLQQLDSEDPEMSYEAARAAGELEIEEAVPGLTRLALDNDREVKEVAIWSLGEIGTKESTRILERLATQAKRHKDDELLEAIEDAIGTASLGGNSLYLMRFDESADEE